MLNHASRSPRRRLLVSSLVALLFALIMRSHGQEQRHVPDHVPPKRSSQIQDGFGINSDMPRDPYLPWNRWWWTRMFDAGFKWIRIGQYENSSDYTSWDWVEQKRGVMATVPELDDYVDSLVDNGMNIQVQLMYGNVMYTSPSGKLSDRSTPEPGSFHNDDRSLYSVFWPPTTPEQTAAFNRYVAWMVNRFHDRIHYWALWNEQDIGYWNPWGNPEQYGNLLASFVPTVHQADPSAKVIYGGQADPSREFTQKALDTCKCAAGIDVYAYHTYPGYGQNLNPEAMDYGAYLTESPRALRDLVTHYPEIKSGIPFFDDEFNSIPSWVGSDESVQAKYVPRGLIYNHAAGVKTFVWLWPRAQTETSTTTSASSTELQITPLISRRGPSFLRCKTRTLYLPIPNSMHPSKSLAPTCPHCDGIPDFPSCRMVFVRAKAKPLLLIGWRRTAFPAIPFRPCSQPYR